MNTATLTDDLKLTRGEATIFLRDLANARSAKAKLLRDTRAILRKHETNVVLFVRDVRRIADRAHGDVLKPTPRAFQNEIKRLMTFARTPVGHRGDEYYSRCGEEDAAGYARDDAMVEAEKLRAMMHAAGWITYRRR